MSTLSTRSPIAIIGAGMAGLAAALRLDAAGYACRIFEKSRGVGGRLATRRAGDFRFDHGAQFFTARGTSFRKAIAKWSGDGFVAPWFEDSYVGVPAIGAPVRAMANRFEVVLETQITSLQSVEGGWLLHDAVGMVHDCAGQPFAGAVLAVPAPQAIPLAESAGASFPGLQEVRYAPCWTLMAAFEETLPGPDRYSFPEGPLSWLARNSAKPGRDPVPEAWVIHASPAWSRQHLELSADEVAPLLWQEARSVLATQAEPGFMAAHRWRYARVEQTAPQPFVWDADLRIGACGDWGLGPRVEAAFDSGEGLGRIMVSSLSQIRTAAE
ncbi:NAD(P)/FAD-dependent oxidoreductase [Pannonibacter carbonis]|uniref:NAD(P)/FAD-dependent oxidoreductase n=1 Tax=Pannonibacter carbonis TaxID=2067569 RepID=UPI000D0F7C5D|nr:FAD-dependent oxidoreductase [Pannonibacter carbonis]